MSTTVSIAPLPMVFGGEDKPLFGVFHPADPERPPCLGVVLCNPLGYEAMCVHRTYRQLAETLAARGIPCLRFDYHGTGDSSGDPSEPRRLQEWFDSLVAAIEALRSCSGATEVGLFGVRFGAALASEVAATRADVTALALWAPTSSGREYVRELRAFRLIRRGAAGARAAERDDEVAGYLFDRSTMSDLSVVDLFASTVPPAPHVLILPRDDLPGTEERLARHFESLGIQVRRSLAAGYARMMRDPQETVVPAELVLEVVEWFAGFRSSERPAPPPRESIRAVMAPRVQGRTVREELLHFGEDRRLFGILTQPTSAPRPDPRRALVCLNVGANHHVGPNRMYVTLARDLACRGETVLRFDVAGLGDSRSTPGSPGVRLYSKHSVGDVKKAMSFLTEACGVDRFVLMGLCSGAYLAFHTAVEDPRVLGQILLNPQTFEWKDGDSLELTMRRSFLGTRYYARSILRRDVWTRTLRGEVDVRGIANALRERLRDRAAAELDTIAAQLRGRRTPRSDVERAFVALSDRGVDTLLVFSSTDGGLDMIEKHLGHNARKMRSRRNFALDIVDGADHTFTPLPSQQLLYALVRRYMARLRRTESAAA